MISNDKKIRIKAAIWSFVLPGSGQCLLGRYGDAYAAVLLTMLFWSATAALMYYCYQSDPLPTLSVAIAIGLIPSILTSVSAFKAEKPKLSAMIICKACQNEISRNASVCPKCGEPNLLKPHEEGNPFVKVILIALTMIGIFWWIYEGVPAETSLHKINRRTAEEFKAQYRLIDPSGSKMEKCVYAGIVAAAYLQAEDKNSYDLWKQKERDDCARAGVRSP